MHELVESLFLSAFGNRYLKPLADGAVLPGQNGRMVFTTDSYVVKPLFFGGGDIGMLSVYGTCNDLSVMGARPRFLSCAFVLEEGTRIDLLERIVQSMAAACRRCGVHVATGDTKVVERGNADGLYINTTGIGFMQRGMNLSPHRVGPGDVLILSGFIGDHGIAVLSARENLELKSPVKSDAAPLWHLTRRLSKYGSAVKFMRDPTRGGLATSLCELAGSSGFSIEISEKAIPVREEVRSTCEILGFDPLYIANEGKLLAVTSKRAADGILEMMRSHSLGRHACIIGEVTEDRSGRVVLNTLAGGRRLVDMLTGEQLPRIC